MPYFPQNDAIAQARNQRRAASMAPASAMPVSSDNYVSPGRQRPDLMSAPSFAAMEGPGAPRMAAPGWTPPQDSGVRMGYGGGNDGMVSSDNYVPDPSRARAPLGPSMAALEGLVASMAGGGDGRGMGGPFQVRGGGVRGMGGPFQVRGGGMRGGGGQGGMQGGQGMQGGFNPGGRGGDVPYKDRTGGGRPRFGAGIPPDVRKAYRNMMGGPIPNDWRGIDDPIQKNWWSDPNHLGYPDITDGRFRPDFPVPIVSGPRNVTGGPLQPPFEDPNAPLGGNPFFPNPFRYNPVIPDWAY